MQRAALDDAIEDTVTNHTAKTFMESDKARPDLYWKKIVDWFEKSAVAKSQAQSILQALTVIRCDQFPRNITFLNKFQYLCPDPRPS